MIKTISRAINKINNIENILVFYPEKFNNIKDKKKIKFDGKSLKVAYIIDICDYIYSKSFMEKTDIIPINATILKKNYGDNYKTYLNYLILHGIIKKVKNYLQGSHSNTFKVEENVVKRIRINDKVLIKKKIKAKLNMLVSNMNASPIDSVVRERLIINLFNIDVDYLEAIKTAEIASKTPHAKNLTLRALENIKNNTPWYSFDKFGRFHSSFTTLKSKIRENHITIQGEELKELDIHNSQPLFLSVFMSNKLSKYNIEPLEYEHFKTLVLNGEFYEYIMHYMGIEKKGITKKELYKILFGHKRNTLYYNIFRELFPSITDFLEQYKKEKQNYKIFSHTLQKMESEFLFNNIIKKALEYNPELIFVTVHDSIMVRKKDFPMINKIFNYYYDRLVENLQVMENV